jgi:hypothetical protein
MFLIDDTVYLKSFKQNGIVKKIHENNKCELSYDIELDEEVNGSYHLSFVPAHELEYDDVIDF